MSTVVPPLPPIPPQLPVVLPRLAILTAPPALLDLALGSKLDVVVSQVLDNGQFKFSSPLGDITLRLPGPATLKTGAPFILQLVGLGAQPKAQLIAPGAQATAQSSPQTTHAGLVPGAPGGATASTGIVNPALHVGAIVTASLVRPLTVNGAFQIIATPGAATPQPASAGGTTTILPGQPSGPATAPSTPAAAASGQASAVQNQNPSGPVTPAAPGTPQTFPVGSGLVLKIISVRPPEGTPPALTPPPAGGPVSLAQGATLYGTVSGRQGVSNTVVQTHAGPMTLPTAQPLSPGTSIVFEIRSLVPPPPTPAQHPTENLLRGDWPALDDALKTLHDISPAAHMQVLQAALPRADAQLATNVLFFLAALRGGDLKSWLGDGPLRILERHRPELAGRLREDMGQMSRRFGDPESGDWRMQGVPFFQNNDIEQFRLLIRDHDDDEEDTDSKRGTRFVIDLDLSRLGHLQIDGLVGEKGKRLDLVLRSDTPLDATMRRDLSAIYQNAMEVTGINGSIGFQAAPAKFIDIPAGPAGTPRGGVVI